jgi:hypothetical protein
MGRAGTFRYLILFLFLPSNMEYNLIIMYACSDSKLSPASKLAIVCVHACVEKWKLGHTYI